MSTRGRSEAIGAKTAPSRRAIPTSGNGRRPIGGRVASVAPTLRSTARCRSPNSRALLYRWLERETVDTWRVAQKLAGDHAYCQPWACDRRICRAQCDGGAGMIRKTAALGAAAALCGLLTVALHAQFGGNQEPPYTPAKDAKDLRAVLFNWTWYTGMLRGIDEHELMVSLEYQANGGSDPGRRPALHADEVSRQHQLSDAGRARSVHVHARQRPGVLERRGRQRPVRVERRHPGRRDRSRQGQGDADGGGGAGAADPFVGESAGRAEGGGSRRQRKGRMGRQPCHTAARRCDDGGEDVRRVGRREAGRHVPDSRAFPARPQRPRSMRSTWPSASW